MNVFDSVKNKNIDEFADWIDKCFSFDGAPFWRYWDKKYCRKCEAVTIIDDDGNEKDFSYCERRGRCRFFKEMDDIPSTKEIIKMWLESEVEE